MGKLKCWIATHAFSERFEAIIVTFVNKIFHASLKTNDMHKKIST